MIIYVYIFFFSHFRIFVGALLLARFEWGNNWCLIVVRRLTGVKKIYKNVQEDGN